MKIDAVRGREVQYHYDIDDPLTYGSNNNRLMFADTFDTGDPSGPVLVETTWYAYTAGGNVERVVTRKEARGPDEPEFTAVRLGYAQNGQAVTYALGETWDTDELGNPIEYAVTFAREFRYDGARARYLDRRLDPVAVMNGDFTTILSETWSDYDGDTSYGDFAVADGVASELRSYQPGVARFDWTGGAPDAGTVAYYGTDHLGTTRLMTDASGAEFAPTTFTAFGERIAGAAQRYGYVGAFGYQTATADETDPYTAFPFLHVGHRYYDPSSGSFLQRDPIGILSRENVYTYVDGRPTVFIDPFGLQSKTTTNQQRCIDACDAWRTPANKLVCGEQKSATNCYASCNDGYWPPAPAPPKPPDRYDPFKDWPDCCPPTKITPAPVEDGRPGGQPGRGCGGGGGGGAAGFILPFFVLCFVHVRRRCLL